MIRSGLTEWRGNSEIFLKKLNIDIEANKSFQRIRLTANCVETNFEFLFSHYSTLFDYKLGLLNHFLSVFYLFLLLFATLNQTFWLFTQPGTVPPLFCLSSLRICLTHSSIYSLLGDISYTHHRCQLQIEKKVSYALSPYKIRKI